MSFFFIFLWSGNLLYSQNEEFRATWVITWNHINASSSVEQHQARVRQILDNHQAANMNAVLWQVRQSGTAYYPSSYEPWGYYAGYKDPGYDHFAYAVEEAHKRGMEIHAWFNVFQAYDTSPGAPAAEHPEWICRDQSAIPMESSISLSPGLAEVRAYLVQVAMEIVRKYDIDGLHLDYVRWNEYSNTTTKMLAKESEKHLPLDGMIPQAVLDELIRTQSGRYLYDVDHPYSGGVPQGFNTWEDWWRWSVTDFVRTLHDSIQSVKPWVRLSPAALGNYNWGGWNGYYVVYQDAALWFNEGYVDQLTPMHYHWTTGDGFYTMLESQWKPNILKGISEGRLFSVGPGSYVLADNNIWNRHPEIVASCREVDWTDGFQFFSYGSWNSYQYWLDAAELFFTTKTKIRQVNHPASVKPPSPTFTVLKLDSLNYQISVTPDGAMDTEGRFAVYRSETENIDPQTDEIIHIQFGKDAFQVIDTFDGLQNFNGSYRYYASTFNRFWRESDPSNYMDSDPIPSFAPTVLSTDPVNNDTISVNASIKVQFSKTMKTGNFLDAVQLTPSILPQSVSWSDGNRNASIHFAGNFAFDTQYTLELSENVTDINGRALDGNGDGIEGDPFVLEFVTKAIDLDGPVITYSNINQDGSTNDFDTEGVISVIFDERIEPLSVNEKTLFILLAQDTVDSKFLIFNREDRSELSAQTLEPFHPGRVYSLTLKDSITDTLGNHLAEDVVIYFQTEFFAYEQKVMIDDFASNMGIWFEPEGSGSTVGIVGSETNFGLTSSNYLPAADRPIYRKSALLSYQWDTAASEFLLRQYLSGGAAREVIFDTSYVLQCYVYGDGSYNKFRFAIDDNHPRGLATDHEVSPWQVIDWVGWKLVSWELKAGETGTWLGDGNLDGQLRFDSFQLTHESGATVKDALYFKELRIVKKTYLDPAFIAQTGGVLPLDFSLDQNYPNPFNPNTIITFSIHEKGPAELLVYDMLGRKVSTLVNKDLMPGRYEIEFDGSKLASGTYVYMLRLNGQVLAKKMILMK